MPRFSIREPKAPVKKGKKTAAKKRGRIKFPARTIKPGDVLDPVLPLGQKPAKRRRVPIEPYRGKKSKGFVKGAMEDASKSAKVAVERVASATLKPVVVNLTDPADIARALDSGSFDAVIRQVLQTPRGLTLGEACRFDLGPKSVNACAADFSNVENYAGFPFIPMDEGQKLKRELDTAKVRIRELELDLSRALRAAAALADWER